MSLFPEFYVTYNVFHPNYDGDTRKGTYDLEGEPDFQIDLNLIRPSDQDLMVEAETLGDWRANAKGSNAINLRESDILVEAEPAEDVVALKYIIVNAPRWNKLFKRNKINVRDI